MGYTYSGPNSFYKITVPEMNRLRIGYQEIHKDSGNGKGKKVGRRDSDNDKLAKFKKKRGLD